MTTSEDLVLCSAHDQIAGRTCRYYAGHGGRHNFARLDHDCTLERDLRRDLDELTNGLAAAIALFDNSWCTAHTHEPRPEAFERANKLRKLGGFPDGNYPPPPLPRSRPR